MVPGMSGGVYDSNAFLYFSIKIQKAYLKWYAFCGGDVIFLKRAFFTFYRHFPL